jgi:hypothetical protein
MAIVHICSCCGLDLARTRPQRDPRSGLNLVHCPRCATAHIRRRHPLVAAAMRSRRLGLTATVLTLQLAMIALLTMFTVGAIAGMLSTISLWMVGAAGHRPYPPSADEIAWLIIAPCLLLAPLTGTWLSTCFPHLRVRQTWLLWHGWIAAIMTIAVAALAIAAMHDQTGVAGQMIGAGASPTIRQTLAAGALGLAGAFAMILVMAAFAMGGVPAGWFIRRAARETRRALWRWRRRHRRAVAPAPREALRPVPYPQFASSASRSSTFTSPSPSRSAGHAAG